jgi:hypothetical protein
MWHGAVVCMMVIHSVAGTANGCVQGDSSRKVHMLQHPTSHVSECGLQQTAIRLLEPMVQLIFLAPILFYACDHCCCCWGVDGELLLLLLLLLQDTCNLSQTWWANS